MLSVTGCSVSGDRGDLDALALGVVVDPAWGQIPAAQSLDLFAKAGVSVKITNFSSGADAMKALLGGAVDVVTAADVPTSSSIVASDKVRVIAQTASHSNMRIVAAGDRGIRQLSDLGGRAIGTALGSSANYMAATTLEHHQVNARLVQVAPPEIRTALTRGDIDAAAIFEPYATQITESLGADAVILPSDPPYTSRVFLNTRADVAAGKRAALSRLLAAVACASRLIEAKTPGAVQPIGKATGLAGVTLEQVVGGYDYRLSLDQHVPETLATLVDWGVAQGKLPAGGKLSDGATYIDSGPLTDSAAVTLPCA